MEGIPHPPKVQQSQKQQKTFSYSHYTRYNTENKHIQSPPQLPISNFFKWVKQHQHIQSQIISNNIPNDHLHQHHQHYHQPDRKFFSHPKPKNHRHNIHHRVKHTITIIIQRDCPFSIPINHQRGILQNLPCRLNHYCPKKPNLPRILFQHQPQNPEKDKSMNNMRKRVPITEMLRILTTLSHSMPQLHRPTLTDRHTTHK